LTSVFITVTTIGGIQSTNHVLNVEIKEVCGDETLSIFQENGQDKVVNIFSNQGSSFLTTND
jgi:hypothetical protein